MKKMGMFLIAGILTLAVISPAVFAASDKAEAGIAEGHNKLCPVSGQPVSGSDFVIYQGVRYGLCCAGCKTPFLSDPAKYIAQMIKQEKPESLAATVTPVVAEEKTN